MPIERLNAKRVAKGIAAAALLLGSLASALACDDYAEEQALAAAIAAAKAARAGHAIAIPAPAAGTATPSTSPAEPMQTAAANASMRP